MRGGDFVPGQSGRVRRGDFVPGQSGRVRRGDFVPGQSGRVRRGDFVPGQSGRARGGDFVTGQNEIGTVLNFRGGSFQPNQWNPCAILKYFLDFFKRMNNSQTSFRFLEIVLRFSKFRICSIRYGIKILHFHT